MGKMLGRFAGSLLQLDPVAATKIASRSTLAIQVVQQRIMNLLEKEAKSLIPKEEPVAPKLDKTLTKMNTDLAIAVEEKDKLLLE